MEVENSAMPRTCPSKSTASKMAFYKSKGKCHRPGPVGRNPYLNFLREFRKRNCGLSAVETVRRGAKEWKSLPKEKKLQYIEAAKAARSKPSRRNLLPESFMSESDSEEEESEIQEEERMCSEEEEEECMCSEEEEAIEIEEKQMRKIQKIKKARQEGWMQKTKAETKGMQVLATGWLLTI